MGLPVEGEGQAFALNKIGSSDRILDSIRETERCRSFRRTPQDSQGQEQQGNESQASNSAVRTIRSVHAGTPSKASKSEEEARGLRYHQVSPVSGVPVSQSGAALCSSKRGIFSGHPQTDRTPKEHEAGTTSVSAILLGHSQSSSAGN